MATINSLNNSSSQLTIDPGASGDSFVQFDINAINEFRIGVDDTDDSFRISQGSALGTNDTLIITANGEITRPLQPACLVIQTGFLTNVTGDGTAYTVSFNSEIFDQNSDFASTTFTAPVTGRYMLFIDIQIRDIVTSGATDQSINFVTSNRTYTSHIYAPASFDRGGAPGTNATKNYQVFADMDSGDTAVVQVTLSGGSKTADIGGVASPIITFFGCQLAC